MADRAHPRRSKTLTSETKYRLLLEISQKVSRTLGLQAILDQLLEAVRSAVPYDAAGVFVLNRNVPLARTFSPDLIAGMAKVGFDDQLASRDPMLRFGMGIVGHVIRTGETVIAPDVRRDTRYVEGRRTTRSEIAVPIVSDAQVIGALDLESDRLDAFGPADAELLQFFADTAAISIEKAMLHLHVLEKQRIEQQLKLAREVQAGLLPAAPPDLAGYDFAAVNLPTWDIGGDYYDYIPLPGDRLGLVIADVSGKGIPAALIMATFRAALRTELHRLTGIVSVMESLNHVVLESSDEARFVTAVYCVLDPPSGRLTYVNCGHNPPLLLTAEGACQTLGTGGPALGLLSWAKFEAATVALQPGDTLALYTDGVVELAGARDAEYGLERLERTLKSCAGMSANDTIRTVVEETRAYAGQNSYEDDFTLVLIKRTVDV